jgi:putative tryptophan/tyrosine transport system substrate-binding protein
MQRREFITLLGGAAAAWPLAARAQQDGRVRRIGWLSNGTEDNPGTQASVAALREGVAKLGWIEGRNLRIDLRFGADNADRFHTYAAELVNIAPDVIVTSGGAASRAVQQQTQTIPIVFTAGGDPVAEGLVRNIARPEGNITGFSTLEPSIAGKWLELLKDAAPHVTRVAIIFVPELATTGASYISSIESAATALGVRTTKSPVRIAVDIVRAIDAFAAEPKGGLVVLPPPPAPTIRETLLHLATEHRLPAIYPSREDTVAGGLMSYQADIIDRSRRAAIYIDRILRGAKVNELPIQFPTKIDLVINLNAAKAIGLIIPEAFLLRADEVIE